MNRIVLWMVVALIWIGGLAAIHAQDDAMAKAVAEYEEWMQVISDFTRGVTFDEGDIREVVQYWPELDELEVMQEEEDATETAAEFARDVRQILADTEYQSWARGNGLDPEAFLKKSMRISTVFMQQQLEGQRAMMASQRESYKAMVEQSCAQVDADTCAQMRAGYEQSIAMGEALMKAMEGLPKPSAAEAALLGKYGSELEAAMMSDDEDDNYDEYYSDDEDYDEDYDEDGG